MWRLLAARLLLRCCDYTHYLIGAGLGGRGSCSRFRRKLISGKEKLNPSTSPQQPAAARHTLGCHQNQFAPGRLSCGGMESTEEVKLELETRIQQDTDPEPKMSTIQAKRRFMITDILNSAVESARDQQLQQGPGLDMRLLFPGSVPPTPSHAHAHAAYGLTPASAALVDIFAKKN